MESFNNKVRVLHVTETGMGGIATYLNELLSLQIDLYGIDSIRLIISDSNAKYIEAIPTNSISIYRTLNRRFLNIIACARLAKKVALEYKPQIIHIHSTIAGLVIRPLFWLQKIPPKIVYCPHGWAFNIKSNLVLSALIKRIEYWLSFYCDAIICISIHEYNTARRIKISEEKLHIIKNGISRHITPSNQIVEWPKNLIKIIFIGRLDRQKGVDILLKAMERLHGIAYARIVGAKAFNNFSLEKIPSNVSMEGWVSHRNLGPYYMSADVLIMPSRWEGFGLVAVEAMRSGLPVIAASVGGLSEIIEDGVSGIFANPCTPETIAEIISSLNIETLSKMGVESKDRFLKLFTSDRMVHQIDDLYKRLLTTD